MTRKKLALLVASFALGAAGTFLAPASAFAKAPPASCNNGMCWLLSGEIVCVYRADWICGFESPDHCYSSAQCDPT